MLYFYIINVEKYKEISIMPRFQNQTSAYSYFTKLIEANSNAHSCDKLKERSRYRLNGRNGDQFEIKNKSGAA